MAFSFKIKNKAFYILLFLGLTIISCDPLKNSDTAVNENHSCSLTDSLLGKEFLEKNFMDAIKLIKPSAKKSSSKTGMVFIKGGKFQMGGDFPKEDNEMPATALPQGDEFPKHLVQIDDFYMDEHEVTIGQYMEFINATNYKTVAEYDINWEELKKQLPEGTPKPSDEQLKAGALVFHLVDEKVDKNNPSNWWVFTQGAFWKNPDGNTVSINEIKNLPVTQVSWYDAMAYAKWMGKRLPTEAEYEYAMRGGRNGTMYPWGNETFDTGNWKGNFLQGDFPYTNIALDGFENIAPVKSFPPNDYGLYDIAGNVWEWTNDWYSPYYYNDLKNANNITYNPQGPRGSTEINNPYATNKVVRGGSFLCHDNWCSGYRNSRRMRLSPDTGMQHIGFRLVKDE